MQAKIVAIQAVKIAGVDLQAGDVFATMDFGHALHAEFFAARLGWSWFRVEIGDGSLVVGTEAVDTLPEVAAILAGQNESTAKATLDKLADLGVKSIADLAKADAKALRLIVGNKAGELTRAAKRTVAELRHIALGGKPTEPAKKPAPVPEESSDDDAPADEAPIVFAVPEKPLAPPKGKKPKGKKS